MQGPQSKTEPTAATLVGMKRLLTLIASSTILLFSNACNMLKPAPTPPYESVIVVEGDQGQYLEGATVTFKTKVVGKSDASGRINLRLRGAEGHVFALNVKCPDGYTQPKKPVTVVLRRLAGDSKAEYRVSCPRAMRRVVVAVRADKGPNLPVVYLGRKVATTDGLGVAHVALDVTPNQSILLKLDTSERKRLRPENPTNSFEVKNADELFVFDQTFTVERPKRVYRRRSKPTGPQPI